MKHFYFLLLLVAIEARSQTSADGLSMGRMAEEGIDSLVIHQMEADIQSGIYPNIHSVLITRHNKLVYEHYWPGKDEVYGNDLGVVAHGRDSLHDIRSNSKSVVSACIGIAIAQGKIKGVGTRIFSFFPAYSNLDTGMKSSLTIRDLLTMTSGLDWNENLPYSDPRNSEIAMDRSPDPVGYVLSQPMVRPPGTAWNYNGGNVEVLAAIIRKVSGKNIEEFAREYLFAPLGITRWEWLKIHAGSDLPAAASGLRLRSRDLLKFGLLYNQGGEWKGRRVFPAQWVDSSFLSRIQRGGVGGPGGYGYFFWTFPETLKDGVIEVPAGVGNGDQKLFIDRKHDLVVVVTAGNYNNFKIRKNANAILEDYIYPALGPGLSK
jgi:CubicO group peptidase (beta-lactamase class C family)